MRAGPRPRDDLGRPLPRDADVALEPDPEPLPPAETLAEAQRLLDAGRAFRAHEVLEATWKATGGAERDLWRGLAQLAVGITHAQRGNRTGSAALLQRAAVTLAPWADARPHGIAIGALRAWAVEAAGAVAGDGELPATPPLRDGSGG